MAGIIFNDLTKYIDLTIKLDLDSYSYTQEIEYDQQCYEFEYFVTWLNSLGGWEYWLFVGEKDYRLDISDDVIATRNRFQDWDTDFIFKETGSFFSTVKAFEEREIRSGRLTKEQADALAKLKYSIQAQNIREDDSKYTILVDKGNINIRRDRDFFAEISFNIRSTDEIAIQEQ